MTLHHVGSIYRKEMRGYLVSPIPYILVSLFSVGVAYFFFEGLGDSPKLPPFWILSAATVENLFKCIPVGFAVVVPALTMRLWSEEYRAGTIETLRTLPISSGSLVMGKFLSAWTLLAVCLLSTVPIAITVGFLGDLDMGPVLGGYLGAMFLGAALLALGLWLSSITRHQIVAFLATLGIGIVLTLVLSLIAGQSPGACNMNSCRVNRLAGRSIRRFLGMITFCPFTSIMPADQWSAILSTEMRSIGPFKIDTVAVWA